MKTLLILFVFIFQGCMFGNNIVISAEGIGSTTKEAKESALQELSRTIISEVNSIYRKKEQFNGNILSKSVEAELTVKSHIILQDVLYTNPINRGGYFYTKAILTKKGLRKSIDYLKDRIDVDIKLLNRRQIEQKLKELQFLTPLVYFSDDKRELLKYVGKKREKFLLKLNFGELKFIVEPKESLIKIDNRVYRPFEPIYLNSGKYFYSIQSRGFQKETGEVYIYRGTRDKRVISLIADVGVKSIEVDVKDLYRDTVISNLKDLNIVTLKSSKRFKLKISVTKKFVTEIDGYKFYNFTIAGVLYRDDEVFYSKKASLRNKTESYIDKNSNRVIKALIRVLFKDNRIEEYFQ